MSKLNIENLRQVGKDYFLKNNYGLYEPITKEKIVAARGHSALTMIKKLKELDGELATGAPEPVNLDEITEESLAFMNVGEIQRVADEIGAKYGKSWSKGRLYDETMKALRAYRDNKNAPAAPEPNEPNNAAPEENEGRKKQKATMIFEVFVDDTSHAMLKEMAESMNGTVTFEDIEPTTDNQEGFAYIPPTNEIEPVQTMETGALRSEENED